MLLSHHTSYIYFYTAAMLVTMVTCFPSQTPGVALVVVDVQDCFLDPARPLHAVGAGGVVPGVNTLRRRYDHVLTYVVYVQDVHCPDHVAFASQHPGKAAFDVVTLGYDDKGMLCRQDNLTSPHAQPCDHVTHHVTQILWPDHCILGRAGTELSPGLVRGDGDLVVRTGNNCQVDTFSAFRDVQGFVDTGLRDALRRRDVTTLLVTGVALQYSVYFTLIDALQYGYAAYLVMDATANASDATEESTNAKVDYLKQIGVHVINIADVDKEVFQPLRQASGGSSHHLVDICLLFPILTLWMMTQ